MTLKILNTSESPDKSVPWNTLAGSIATMKSVPSKPGTATIEQGANIEIVQREIYIHQRLIHENIIRLYSSHEDKYSFYLVI